MGGLHQVENKSVALMSLRIDGDQFDQNARGVILAGRGGCKFYFLLRDQRNKAKKTINISKP